MMIKRKIVKYILSVLVLLATGWGSLSAQEISAGVTLDYSQLQGTNVSAFKTLEAALNEFLNNRTWTDQEYLQSERIECNFTLTITAIKEGAYEGSLAVTARRPIYNTSINTTLINLIDNDVKFKYKEFDPLVFNKNSLSQDITAILGFYVYMILGVDGDTFKEFGGDVYYNEAMDIVNSAQSSATLQSGGWDRLGSKKNRSLLVSEVLSSEFKEYRSYNYRYHRLGLDVMADDVEKGAAVIIDGLSDLVKVNENNPSSYTMQLFLDAKNVELQNIVSEMDESNAEQRKEVITKLKTLDPGRVKAYERLED